jgi:hypothetical protein
VLGEFQAVNLLGTCFTNRKKLNESSNTAPKKRAMWLFIIPWAVFWVSAPLWPRFGVYLAVIIAALTPLFACLRKLTPYDTVGAFLVTALGLLTIAGCNLAAMLTLSYGLFGLVWLSSLFLPVPLCAWYSSEGYGGDAAFNNKLFILTNRILSGCWGGMYLLTALWTWFIMHSSYAPFTGLINTACPAILGVFTRWFAKWYPARYANKGIVI